MTPNELVDLCERNIPDLLEESGCLLLTSTQTVQLSRLYVIGFNPGGRDSGKPEDKLKNSIRHSILADQPWFPHPQAEDRKWANRSARQMQRGLRAIAATFRIELGDLCASNLIFTRTTDASGVAFPEDADQCWPIHEALLEIVRPEVIVTNGNSSTSAFAYLQQKCLEVAKFEPFGASRKRCCRAFRGRLSHGHVTVIGLPHLSRFSLRVDRERCRPILDWMYGVASGHAIPS